jgi:hypothetical protein
LLASKSRHQARHPAGFFYDLNGKPAMPDASTMIEQYQRIAALKLRTPA